ncbi:FAD-dependent monooxygenase [Cyclobacterium plantarum]|uniref:FAD-dependent monooxygenase n=1 Tax=Cyclobacterium plantarum TaxID=2716263 RepID=UPI003F7265DF
MRGKKVLIVGGGIAGPAIAIKLIHLGAEVKIIEARKKEEMNEGLFMGISPNGLNILKDLINISEIYQEYAPGTLHFKNSKGKKIAALDTAYQLLNFGIRSIQIKRSAISNLLHKKLNQLNHPVLYDCRLYQIDNFDKEIKVSTSQGEFGGFDFLIAADGIHSKCRSLCLPNSPKPIYTKLLSTGAIVDIPNWQEDSKAMNMIFGERAFFAYGTSNHGKVWWFNNFHLTDEPERNVLNVGLKQRIKTQMLDIHKNDEDVISHILRETGDFFTYPIYEMPPINKWYGDNFCLIGDAAHAISPHTGQGASLALEDAAILSRCLEKYTDHNQAFKVFQGLRQERVQKIISQARKVGKTKTKPNPVGNFFRDFFLKKFIHLEQKKMDWVYGFKPESLEI